MFRNILLFALLAFSLLMTACNKDGASEEETRSPNEETSALEEEGTVFDEEDLADLYEEEPGSVVEEEDYDNQGADQDEASGYENISESNNRLVETQSAGGGDADLKGMEKGGGEFLVVVGNFTVKEYADDLVSKLIDAGFPGADIVYFNAREYHTVIAGEYSEESLARDVAKRVKQANFEAYVHKKRYRKE